MKNQFVINIFFVGFGLVSAVPTAHAADLNCNEASSSSIACVFDIVERLPGTHLDSPYKSIERYILKGGEKKTLPDSYIGREYCFNFVASYYNHPRLTPEQAAMVSLPPLDKPCFLPPKPIEATNEVGGWQKQDKPFMPLDFPQEEVTRCELISDQFKNRPYVFGKDGIAFWAVSAPGHYFVPDSFISEAEHAVVTRVCKDKWILAQSEEKITDFDPPTYIGFEKFKSQNGQEVTESLDLQFAIKDGRQITIKGYIKWYLLYRESFLEARVTNNKGQEVSADNLSLIYRDVNSTGTIECGKNSYCSYGSRLYLMSAMNKGRLCGIATARIVNEYLSVKTSSCP